MREPEGFDKGQSVAGLIIKRMVINMDESLLRTIAQLQEFLKATPDVEFTAHGGDSDRERYGRISRVLMRFDYPRGSRAERGVVRACLVRTSGYSRAQLTRLVTRWGDNRLGAVPLARRYRAPAAPFARKYSYSDIELLVEMDRANEDVCGPAIVHLLQRAWRVYGDARYERLAGLSVSPLYNLRKSTGYQSRRRHFTKTRSVVNPIGLRRAPRPNGRAGFVRIDTVHQGDLDGITMSRSRQSNDNALAESKNASVVRKHMGYSHIPQKFATPISAFYQQTFNPWLNHHRPCLFATEVISDKGKIKKRYRHDDVKTPLACLQILSCKGLVEFKKGVPLRALQAEAKAQTDLASAQQMQRAKADLFELFELFNKPRPRRQA